MARLTVAMPHVLRRIGQRRVLVMGDQAVSSLSNIVVTILVARALSPTLFGAFGVAMVAYQLALGAVRAVIGEPWLSAHSADSPEARARAASDLARAALVASAVASLVVVAVGVVVGGSTLPGLVVLAAVFPFLGLQDSFRHVAVIDRPGLAVASDTLWLLLASAGTIWLSSGEPAEYVAIWGVAGALSLAPLIAGLGLRWRGGSARYWFGSHRQMSGAFFGEFLSARAVSHLVILALGVVVGGEAGLRAVGAVRGAQVFYGPLNALFAGVYLALVPDGARLRHDRSAMLRLMVLATVLVTGVATLWLVAGLVLPDAWGHRLFGDTWNEADELMLPMGFGVIAGSLATGAFAGLRALGASRASLRARLIGLPPHALLSLGGAMLGAAMGFTVGFAVGNVVLAVIWWASFMGALRARTAEPVPSGQHPLVAVAGSVED